MIGITIVKYYFDYQWRIEGKRPDPQTLQGTHFYVGSVFNIYQHIRVFHNFTRFYTPLWIF